ncbi:MAG: hypothetical protein DRP88_06245, partial [Candidatus Neomarinimicrobiota bacterium]
GEKIKTLVSESQELGRHFIFWDGKDGNGQVVSSGIYFVKMMVENFGLTEKQQLKTQKLVLLK